MATESFKFKSKVRVAISYICNLQCKYCDNSHFPHNNRTAAMEDFRKRPINEGMISLQEYLQVLQSFYKNGFTKINLTGGEPMLNPEWSLLVNEAKHIGFESIEMTTNGTLISNYLDKEKEFPKNLNRLIISMDTHDPIKYKETVGQKTQLSKVIEGIQKLKQSNSDIKLTANCVLCQSNRTTIKDYINFVVQLGFDSVTFLDLVVRDKRNQREIEFFKKEFLSGNVIKQEIKKTYGELEVSDGRHSYNLVLPNGLNVSVVDIQGLTRRDSRCDSCSQYCQEGFYTAKIATDGTIIDCFGGNGISIDGRYELQNNTLDAEIQKIYKRLANGKLGCHFNKFYQTLSGSQEV